MRYSTDLRKRVLDFIKAGGSKAEASRRFSITRVTIDRWLKAKDPFAYYKPGGLGLLTMMRSNTMSPLFQTKPSKNVPIIFVFLHFVSNIV